MTTIEIAIMIFIAALVAIVIYKIATRTTNEAVKQTDEVLKADVQGKKLKPLGE